MSTKKKTENEKTPEELFNDAFGDTPADTAPAEKKAPEEKKPSPKKTTQKKAAPKAKVKMPPCVTIDGNQIVLDAAGLSAMADEMIAAAMGYADVSEAITVESQSFPCFEDITEKTTPEEAQAIMTGKFICAMGSMAANIFLMGQRMADLEMRVNKLTKLKDAHKKLNKVLQKLGSEVDDLSVIADDLTRAVPPAALNIAENLDTLKASTEETPKIVIEGNVYGNIVTAPTHEPIGGTYVGSTSNEEDDEDDYDEDACDCMPHYHDCRCGAEPTSHPHRISEMLKHLSENGDDDEDNAYDFDPNEYSMSDMAGDIKEMLFHSIGATLHRMVDIMREQHEFPFKTDEPCCSKASFLNEYGFMVVVKGMIPVDLVDEKDMDEAIDTILDHCHTFDLAMHNVILFADGRDLREEEDNQESFANDSNIMEPDDEDDEEGEEDAE